MVFITERWQLVTPVSSFLTHSWGVLRLGYATIVGMTTYPRYRVVPECGTRSGYDYHIRQAVALPCKACREAEAKYHRERRVTHNERINEKRRSRREVLKEEGKLSTVRWGKRVEEIVAEHGSGCYLESNCLLGQAPIDYSAPRQVGATGWEYAFHPDHVIPMSRGGSDTLDNIRPIHAYCNQRKWATHH
jgi:5-methylcytosine-specific restriction endonuclease McrA